ncbi:MULTISPECIES: TOBE domain-containing protein [Methanosarcina]|uniref:Transport-associated OB type 1 domain-containing protein n=1 Tax=Methanosarcina mazei TaxID=2209 RepID=A0A6C0VRD3_METMZ|nr:MULTISPECIES: TOBE domain-containing protein [Methanosarcina]MDO5839473.1 TOBE domain-containing protein [Methanosarcina mazei]MDY0245317.1 TOBE domain-containing protein [Methanosarcina mazei]NLO29301.1 TOBE domain-containing protein [Methanosarcina mazei]QIB92453.1 hypothetical protein FQU78_16705 [Methanosarcina mazei]WIM44760.1 TOBE domain-containing protein [Methanosarcina mazei]
MNCGITLNALITWKSAEKMDISPDARVYARFRANSVHVLR